jgi:hypothetical protein
MRRTECLNASPIPPRRRHVLSPRLRLRLRLDANKGVPAKPVIRNLNGGADDVALSTPGSNSGRKKTDLTLGKTEPPNLNLRGDVMTFRFAEPTDRPTSGTNTGKDCGRTTLVARD